MTASAESQAAAAARARTAVTWLHYAAGRDVTADAAASLPSADRDERAAHTRGARRAQHLAGRVLLRAMLEDFTARPAAEHEIRTTARGRPECVAGPSVSVSHSGGWIACALASRPAIGVDVQARLPGRRVADIARHYFAPEESAWVAADPTRRFYMLWVLKEAYLKALGLGIAGGLRSLQCRIEPPAIEIAAARSPALAVELRLYALRDAYVGLASVDGPLGEVVVRRLSRNPGRRWLPGSLALVAATPRRGRATS